MSSVLWRRNKRAEERRKNKLWNYSPLIIPSHISFTVSIACERVLLAKLHSDDSSIHKKLQFRKLKCFVSMTFSSPQSTRTGDSNPMSKIYKFCGIFLGQSQNLKSIPTHTSYDDDVAAKWEREKWKKIIFLHWISIAIMTFRCIKWNANISLCIVRVKVSNVELLTIKLAQLSRRTSDDQRNTFQYIFRCQCSFWDSDAYPRVSSRVYPCKNNWILREMEWSLLL